MNLKEHKKLFEEIIEKYKLNNNEKASEISNYLIDENKISYKQFAITFNLDEEDAKIFLSFIYKGIQFKEMTDKYKKNKD